MSRGSDHDRAGVDGDMSLEAGEDPTIPEVWSSMAPLALGNCM